MNYIYYTIKNECIFGLDFLDIYIPAYIVNFFNIKVFYLMELFENTT